MERVILFVILYIAVEGDLEKHVYVRQSMIWTKAQAYCREHHTDLSFLNGPSDVDKLRNAAGGQLSDGWIGLQRDPNNSSAWKWSGGGYITYQNWAFNQPDNHGGNQNSGIINSNGKWFDRFDGDSYHFYCYDVIIVKKMSWEDALSHCREKQADLPSLLSETDHLLVQNTIQPMSITERMWIGLRFLGDHWLWVNGDPLEYEAWSEQGDQDHQCPMWKRCGALTTDGLWVNWDCQDELSFICI